MTPKFLDLIAHKETVLVFHGEKGEMVILHEKQPQRNTERLLDRFSAKEKFMLECALDAKCEGVFPMDEYVCDVVPVAGHSVAAVVPGRCLSCPAEYKCDYFTRLAELELDAKHDTGFCFAKDMLSRIITDIINIHPDMELELEGGANESDLFDISVPNLIRICMLCTEIADAVSSDRKLRFVLESTKEELKLSAMTGCVSDAYKEESVEFFVSLARFACEKEEGRFDILRDKGTLIMSFVFRSQPDEIPEFKFRDQFVGYDKYFASIEKEMTELRAEQQSKHKN